MTRILILPVLEHQRKGVGWCSQWYGVGWGRSACGLRVLGRLCEEGRIGNEREGSVEGKLGRGGEGRGGDNNTGRGGVV